MVSIILSCYNGEKFLEEAIVSVLTQDYEDIELIFVNDGSTDKSLAIAERFATEDKRIHIFSIENSGLNAARNYGAKCSSEKADALLFFDADDMMEPPMIRTLYASLQKENEIGAVYCAYKTIDVKGTEIKKKAKNKRIIPTKYWFKNLAEGNPYTPFFSIYSWTEMGEAFTMIRKELFFKYSGWDEKNFPKGDTFGESIPLFGQIALTHKIVYINQPLYIYRRHYGQITQENPDKKSIQKKLDRIMLNKLQEMPQYKSYVHKAIAISKYRLPLYDYLHGSFKHDVRYHQLSAFKAIFVFSIKYVFSLLFLSVK